MAKSVREIDRDDNIYVGVKFPLDYNRATGFFNQSKTIQEQSKSNLIPLLNWRVIQILYNKKS